MDGVYEWEQEIKAKNEKLKDLFEPILESATPKEVVYFENPLSGMEHYFFRIGEVNEDIWEDEICKRFYQLCEYLEKYWVALGIENLYDLNKEQFRMISSIFRISGVHIDLNIVYVLVINGWSSEVVDKLKELWGDRMFSITDGVRSIATWYRFAIDEPWTK